jgi:hypothetical protein
MRRMQTGKSNQSSENRCFSNEFYQDESQITMNKGINTQSAMLYDQSIIKNKMQMIDETIQS